jgi:hypothetical protein
MSKANRNRGNLAVAADVTVIDPEVTATTPAVIAETNEAAKTEGGSTGQARALRQDTKIAGRTHAAIGANKAVVALAVMALDGLVRIQDDAVRAASRGTMLVSPGAYIVGLGNREPTPKAPQHQLAIAAFRNVLGEADAKTTGADLHAVQVEYEKLGGTDLSIFTGKTRLFTNSTKSAKVANVAQAPLTVFAAPLVAGTPASEGDAEGGEGEGEGDSE